MLLENFKAMLIPDLVFSAWDFLGFFSLFPILRNFTVVCLGVVCFSFAFLSCWWAIQFGNSWPLVLEKFPILSDFFTSICLLGVLLGILISQRSDFLN